MKAELAARLLVPLLALTIAGRVAASPIVNNVALDSTRAVSEESNLGDLVTDALRSQAGTPLALLPASELRAVVIDAGHIDTAQLVQALRASTDQTDTVVILKLTGSQLARALERSLARSPSPYQGFLQVSGLRVTFDASQPGSHRISSVVIGASGAALDSNESYSVATSRLLGDGTLGYFEIWDKSAVVRDTGVPLAKAVADFALSAAPLSYKLEGRIRTR